MAKDILVSEVAVYVSSDNGATWTSLGKPTEAEYPDFRPETMRLAGHLQYAENAMDIAARLYSEFLAQRKTEIIKELEETKYDLEQAQQYKDAGEVKKLLDQVRAMNEQEFDQWLIEQSAEGEG